MLPSVIADEEQGESADTQEQEKCRKHSAAQAPQSARPPPEHMPRRDPTQQVHAENRDNSVH